MLKVSRVSRPHRDRGDSATKEKKAQEASPRPPPPRGHLVWALSDSLGALTIRPVKEKQRRGRKEDKGAQEPPDAKG